MTRPYRCVRLFASVGAFASCAALPAPAHAVSPERALYILTNDNRVGLVVDGDPAQASAVPVAGLLAGDVLVGLALRSQNNRLYGFARTAADGVQLYHVDVSSGAPRATPVGASGAFVTLDGSTPVPVTGTAFGVDFNPVADRLGVVTDTGQNFRVDPNTGAFVDGNPMAPGTQMDGALNGGATRADATAFTNSIVNATQATQYTLDSASDSLFIQGPPGSGTLTGALPITLGGTPLNFASGAGLDIPSGIDVTTSGGPALGEAYATLTVGGNPGLYRVDLASGAASLLGLLNGLAILDVEVATGVPAALALSADGARLHRFALEQPGTLSSIDVTGVAAGERLVGIDIRPGTAQYFGVGIDPAANIGTLYRIDPQPGAANVATPIGAPGQLAFVDAGGNPVDLPDGSYGFDFDPVADRARVIADSGRNFRVNPITGAPVDANTSMAGVQCDFDISGSGIAGASATAHAGTTRFATQFTLDPLTNVLAIQTLTSSGIQTLPRVVTLARQPLDFANTAAFDIPPEATVPATNAPAIGDAYAVLTVGGATNLYRIALADASATLLGTLGDGTVPMDGLVVGTATPGPERGFLGLTGNGQVVLTTESQPGLLAPPLPISGLIGADTLVSLDVRPMNNRIYGLGFDPTAGSVRLYHLDVNGGVALVNAVGVAGSHTAADGVTPVPVVGTAFGIDFNPVLDRVRVVTNAGQNFRFNPNTGALVDGDVAVPGVQMDGMISGAANSADDVAYSDNVINATSTTEYLVDNASNALLIQNPPNSGTTTFWRFIRTGPAPAPVIDFDEAGGFDIPPDVSGGSGTSYLTLLIQTLASLSFQTVDIGTGISAERFRKVRDTASRMQCTNSLKTIGLAMHANSEMSRFELDRPSAAVRIVASGLTVGERLVGIDIRPTTGQFYSLGINDVANTGTLYLVDPQSGAVTAVGLTGQVAYPGVDFGPGSWGFDFNPTVDLVRVVSDAGLNFRIDPDTGAPLGATPDGAINGVAAGVSATAYTNPYPPAFPGSTVTTLYTLDAAGNQLLIQNPPNDGTQTLPLPITFQGAPLDFGAIAGFDIATGSGAAVANAPATGAGYAALTVGGSTRIFRIDLASGTATSLGTLGNGTIPAEGLVVGAAPIEVALSMAGAAPVEVSKAIHATSVPAGAGSVAVTVTRSGGAPLAVNYATESRTAIPGADYTPVAGTLYFAANEFTKQITIPILPDVQTGEGNETFALVLTGPFVSGGSIVITIGADLVFRNGFE